MNLTDLTDILIRSAGLPAGTDLTDDTRALTDAGVDSLAYLQLQAEITDQYGVELPDDAQQAGTFTDIVAFVNAGLTNRVAA
jgi:minimal PKS acyl carrier protein